MTNMRNNKQISFILYSPFPNYSGGRETWLFNIIKRMDEIGYKITIYTYKDNSINQFFDLAQFNNVTLKYTYILESIFILKKLSRSYIKILNFVLFNFQVFLRTFLSKDDIFIALGPITESLSLCWLKKLKPKIKYICSVRGLHAVMLSDTYPRLSKSWYKLEKYTIQKADITLCNGYDTQSYIDKLGINSYVMPNGVDFKYFKNNTKDIEDSSLIMNNNETFYIVSTATIQDIKGIQPLLKSLGILKDSTKSDFKVIWVGKGNVNLYDEEIISNKVSDNIIFIGERKNTSEFLRKADVVLCLSGGGGMSMALLEAMASKKIIIAWNTPIYTQLIQDGISGILVEENNYAKLADRIEYVIKNKKQLENLGIEAQKIASEFDWNIITHKLIDFIER
jgi:glycosyltransferase involved in cell wall biosynthesis